MTRYYTKTQLCHTLDITLPTLDVWLSSENPIPSFEHYYGKRRMVLFEKKKVKQWIMDKNFSVRGIDYLTRLDGDPCACARCHIPTYRTHLPQSHRVESG